MCTLLNEKAVYNNFCMFIVQRSEALQAALAKRLTATQDPDMPAPFKRQSLMRRKPVENGTQPQLHGGFGKFSLNLRKIVSNMAYLSVINCNI